jgi:DNA-binding transcriptional regulator YdaS (Cro superfamily)
MTKQEAVEHFGSQRAVADALGIKQSSVAEWGMYPPETRQLQLHRVTRGKLKAEQEVLQKFGEPRAERRAAA